MRWKRTIVALALCAVCAGQQASALEYTIDAPADYLFGRSSSVEVVYRETEPVNTDRSKNVSLIPPAFGSPTSYLPGSGVYLTPNLVPGALSGGLVSSLTGAGYTGSVSYGTVSASYGTGTVSGGGGAVQYPSVDGMSYSGGVSYGTGDGGTVQYPGVDTVTWSYEPYSDNTGFYGISFTDVTDDLYYSGGHLGTLKIPSIGVNVKIYEGTGTTPMQKGAGHFTDTSIWDGNVSLAGHNRGPHAIFGKIHTLEIGDTMTLTTKLGTRTYSVVSVKKVSETDSSDTLGTWENCVTLYTCVQDQSAYRWCVRAVELSG